VDTISIQYCFTLSSGSQKVFHLRLDAKTLDLIIDSPCVMPLWTNLDFNQCPNCPLTSDSHPYCPLAISLIDIVEFFDEFISYDQIRLSVSTEEREISQKTTAQKGLSSLMGLVMATSGCPHTAFFKPMARFHLPLASKEETIYRATSMYLLAQYFLKNEGKTADFDLDGLRKIYQDIQVVNTSIAKRLGAWTSKDSTLNAIVLLDLYARALPQVLEDSLKDIHYLFSPFFNQG